MLKLKILMILPESANVLSIKGKQVVQSTLVNRNEVRNGTTTIGQRSTAKDTRNQPENQQCGRVGRESTAGREEGEEDVARVVDDVASVDFGEGGEY